MNALRRLHAALVPGGLVVDTQPVSARPPVEAGGVELGTLDMRDWQRTIDAVDRRVAETVDSGLFAVEAERRFVVVDRADDGPALVETVMGWQGTTVPDGLARRIAEAADPRASGGAAAPVAHAGVMSSSLSWRVGAVDLVRLARPLHDSRYR